MNICRKSPTLASMNENQFTVALWTTFGLGLLMMFITFAMVKMELTNLCVVIPYTLFVICESLIFSVVMLQYDLYVIEQTIGITLTTVIACVGFILITKKDLHSWHGLLFCALIASIIASIVFSFFPPNRTVDIAYSIIGILIFVGYLLVDTSDMIYVYKEDEYFLAAIAIYLDILNLMVKIARLLNAIKSKE